MDYEKVGFGKEDLTRATPAKNNLEKSARRKLEEIYVPEYMDFLARSRVPKEVVNNVLSFAKSNGYIAGINDSKPFFVSSSESNAFAVVNPGKGSHRLNKGIRLIFTHVDSPCLKLKTSPTFLPGSHDDISLLPGVLLEAQNYGYIIPPHWLGRNLRLVGEFFSNGKTRKIELPVFSSVYGAHVRDGDIEITEDNFKIETGAQSVRELYDLFGIQRESDFARIRTYIIPDEKPRLIGNNEFISGYGHDDKACIYAALKALTESKPSSPCFVFGLDKEEIGSKSPNAAFCGFVRRVISETITRFLKNGRRARTLEELIDRGILKGVPAISADVEAGASVFELENKNIDKSNIAKVLHGPFVYVNETSDGNSITLRHLDYIITLFNENLDQTERMASQRYQLMGNPLTPSHGEPSATLANIFVKHNIPIIDIGLPVIGIHNPTELISKTDLYWTIQAYKVYFEKRPSFRIGK